MAANCGYPGDYINIREQAPISNMFRERIRPYILSEVNTYLGNEIKIFYDYD